MMTLKGMSGSKPRVQKIGYINDILKKVSDHYYIVRETNKKHKGYHFHALYSVKRDFLKKEFHRKHIHICVRDVGKRYVYDPVDPRDLPLEYETPCKDLLEWSQRHIKKVAAKMSAARASIARRKTKERNVDNVVYYLSKSDDRESDEQYVDYILVMNGQSCRIVD